MPKDYLKTLGKFLDSGWDENVLSRFFLEFVIYKRGAPLLRMAPIASWAWPTMSWQLE